MERITKLTPAYDWRDKDPAKNYGVHCADLHMVLKGPKGAVQFVVFTGWYLPGTPPQNPTPAGLGYHSPTPRWEGQEINREECPYLDGKPCYYGVPGPYTMDEEFMNVLLREGSEAVWERLEGYYHEVFGE